MGVYINMEMPTNCESCPCKTADSFGGLACQATGYIPLRKANQDRPKNCPLVPVPPHGRLIDADALSEKMVERSKHILKGSFEWDLCGEVITQLALAPTIIPAEEGEG